MKFQSMLDISSFYLALKRKLITLYFRSSVNHFIFLKFASPIVKEVSEGIYFIIENSRRTSDGSYFSYDKEDMVSLN